MGDPEFPRLYPIVDEGLLRRHGLIAGRVAEELKSAGVQLLQYRDKLSAPDSILRSASIIWEVFAETG